MKTAVCPTPNGRRIRALRRERRLSQEDLYRRLGLSERTYRAIETQNYRPARRPNLLQEIAECLNVTLDDVVYSTGRPRAVAQPEPATSFISRFAKSYAAYIPSVDKLIEATRRATSLHVVEKVILEEPLASYARELRSLLGRAIRGKAEDLTPVEMETIAECFVWLRGSGVAIHLDQNMKYLGQPGAYDWQMILVFADGNRHDIESTEIVIDKGESYQAWTPGTAS